MAKQIKFEEDPVATRLHTEGLGFIKESKDYRSAHARYRRAMNRLHTSHGAQKLDNKSLIMQSARIVRDDAFVHVREAVRPWNRDPADSLGQALEKLKLSKGVTEALKAEKAPLYSPDAWRYLRAEHGATLGLIARTATVAYVLGIELEVSPSPYYVDAYDDLHNGSNRYYETNDCMSAARQKVIEGTSGLVWSDRAWRSVIQAQKDARLAELEGRDNIDVIRDTAAAAEGSYVSRKTFLTDPETARESVFRRP
jgi:hypothetical protein